MSKELRVGDRVRVKDRWSGAGGPIDEHNGLVGFVTDLAPPEAMCRDVLIDDRVWVPASRCLPA